MSAFGSPDFKPNNLDKRRLTKLEDLQTNSNSASLKPNNDFKHENEMHEPHDFDLKKELLACISEWATATTCNLKKSSMYLLVIIRHIFVIVGHGFPVVKNKRRWISKTRWVLLIIIATLYLGYGKNNQDNFLISPS
jgi:hypothetical protein